MNPIFNACDLLLVAGSVSKVLTDCGIKHCICGSIRRQSETGTGIECMVESLPDAAAHLYNYLGITYSKKPKTAEGAEYLLNGIPVCLYEAWESEWGAMQIYLTGNRAFFRVLGKRAKDLGYKFSRYGVFFGDVAIAGKTEEQVFYVLGAEYIKPENRNFSFLNCELALTPEAMRPDKLKYENRRKPFFPKKKK